MLEESLQHQEVLNFGKHKGKTFWEAAQFDDYTKWTRSNQSKFTKEQGKRWLQYVLSATCSTIPGKTTIVRDHSGVERVISLEPVEGTDRVRVGVTTDLRQSSVQGVSKTDILIGQVAALLEKTR